MATRIDPTDPVHMTTEDRLAEVATILAASILRLHRRGMIVPSGDEKNYSESGKTGLDVRPENRLHGHRG